MQTRAASPTLESACACLVPPILFNHQSKGVTLVRLLLVAFNVPCLASSSLTSAENRRAGEQPGLASTPAPSTQRPAPIQHPSSTQHRRQRQLAPLFRPTCHHLVSSPATATPWPDPQSLAAADWIGSRALVLVPGKRRGSTDFHTPHACAHAKASAPPEQKNPNLLVHEAASVRRILHRLLSPRPGFLTPFIIAEQLLRQPHHRPRLLPSSPSPSPSPPRNLLQLVLLTFQSPLPPSAAAIFCRTLR